ncbi:MAG: 16S rRNA (guanine(966)-N(2))-methyltransferase RsmD [Alphaproteobacteria bacterium]|nr:16S rRNA (guanine(966)-N(2))-methyltransferase RsmD [Alphaproteobacteria bacterium]
MRIIAGKFGGRKLLMQKGKDIRPTSDKVRGAIFNALQSREVIEDMYVLDCFCGTGALGLEALSRGAKHCTFIDKNRASLNLAVKNAQTLNVKNSEFILKDITKLELRPDNIFPANLVFLDPPYKKDLLISSLNALYNQKWLEKDAFIIAEVENEFKDSIFMPYEILSTRTYGDTKILFLCYKITPE